MSDDRRSRGATGARKPGKVKGPWSRGWRRALKWALALGALFLTLGVLAFAAAYALTDIPDPNEGFETQTSYVYYADGTTVLGKFAEQDRTSIDLAEVPQHVQDAVIAAEDRSFSSNQGIDPKGILRAAFNNARGGDTQGASTITQQYVKVFYLSQDRTWSRKAKEAILSLKIQRQLSKDQILEGYLNTIYFGRGAYGIEAAAQAYFGVPARELDVRQGAALAAVINSPNNYDPAEGKAAKAALKTRYNYVLDSMESMGTLPGSVADAPKRQNLPVFPAMTGQSRNAGQRGHVLTMVRKQLNRLGYTDAQIDGGGLRVTTTFTRKVMAATQRGALAERPALPQLHVAVASVDPRSGALRGVFAGQDYLKSQLNWAVAGGAPGSTFKPFTLATALGHGYSLESTFDGSSPLTVNGTEFSNQGEGGGTSYGTVSLLTATEKSINTAYVDLADSLDVGVRGVIDTAVSMGIPRDAPGLDPNLSIVLGSATVSPIDMAGAYGTIAAEGVAKDVFFVDSVRSVVSDETYEHEVETSEALDPDVAADTSYALQQVAEVGTGTNANVIGRPIAGKTGTATTDGGRVRSSWFVGYTPQLSTAVMYSRGNGNEPLDGYIDTFYGGEHPARTWASVMSAALEGEEVLDFPPPAMIEQTVEGTEPTEFPTPTPTQQPSPSTTPSQTSTPTQTPSQTPTGSPTPSRTPTQTPSDPGPSVDPSPSAPTPTPGQEEQAVSERPLVRDRRRG